MTHKVSITTVPPAITEQKTRVEKVLEIAELVWLEEVAALMIGDEEDERCGWFEPARLRFLGLLLFFHLLFALIFITNN